MAPERAKPLPETVAEFIVRGAVPDDVKVSVLVEEEFVATLPKSTVLALTLSCGLGDATPFPVRVTIVELLVDEFVDIVRLPLAAAALVGAKLT